MKAFPQEGQIEYRLIGNNWVVDKEQGMNLRDYFAAKALQGLLNEAHDDFTNQAICELSYSLADTMMEVRNATK